MTKFDKLGILKQEIFILLQFWRLEIQTQDVGRTMLPPKTLGKKNPSLPIPDCWWLQEFLGLRQHTSKLGLHHFMAFSSVCLCLAQFSPLLINNHTGCRALSNLAWSHPNLTNYICKDLFPVKVIFWGSGKTWFWGGETIHPSAFTSLASYLQKFLLQPCDIE